MEYFIEKKYLLKAYKIAKDQGKEEVNGDIIFDGLKKFDCVSYNLVQDGKVFMKLKMENDLFKYENCDLEINRNFLFLAHGQPSSQEEFNNNFNKYINFLGECLFYLLNYKPEIYENYAEIKTTKGKFEKKERKKVVFLRYVDSQIKTKRLLPGRSGIKHDHKYSVCGFWRKCQGIGKNINGDYNQLGKTWVVNHVRGSGEYIYKPRIVTGTL